MVRVGLASLAKRLVKLAPRFVLSGARPHRLDHVLHRARQRLHLVGESFDVEEQGVLRPRELVDGRAQACELVAHTGQGRLGGGVGGLRVAGERSWSKTSVSLERKVRDLAREGLKLSLKGLAILKKGVLGVIDFFEEFADADELVGDSAEVLVIGVVAKGHQDDPWVGRGWFGVTGKEASEAGAALRSPRRLASSP